MTGYVRQSGNTINVGQKIKAASFNSEFDALSTAFDAVNGHTHDGSAGSGGPLTTSATNLNVAVGTLPIAHGGTGVAANTLADLQAALGIITSSGTTLIDLSTETTGILPYNLGGTGVSVSSLPALQTALGINTSGTASHWTTPITLSLTGDVTGSASVDGSTNVSLATTIVSGNTPGVETLVTGTGTSVVLNGNAPAPLSYTMTGTTTFSATNIVAGKVYTFLIKLIQDSTGSRAFSLAGLGTVQWPYGEVPTWPTTANSYSKFVLETWDGGTTWQGSFIGALYA